MPVSLKEVQVLAEEARLPEIEARDLVLWASRHPKLLAALNLSDAPLLLLQTLFEEETATGACWNNLSSLYRTAVLEDEFKRNRIWLILACPKYRSCPSQFRCVSEICLNSLASYSCQRVSISLNSNPNLLLFCPREPITERTASNSYTRDACEYIQECECMLWDWYLKIHVSNKAAPLGGLWSGRECLHWEHTRRRCKIW